MKKLYGIHYVSIAVSILITFASIMIILNNNTPIGFKVLAGLFLLVVIYIYGLIALAYMRKNYELRGWRIKKMSKKEKRKKRIERRSR
jgi:uncharacterized membrane protein